jgi:hypothetical protein
MAVELTLGGSDEAAVENLRANSDKILAALMDELNSLMLQLQSTIVGEKLHGQVLQQRTGKLAASIRVVPATLSGTELSASVEGGGGPAYYGKFLEYGTEPYDIVPVNAKALAFMMNGEMVFTRLVHHPGLPERSFMRSSLDEFQETIVQSLQATLTAAVSG